MERHLNRKFDSWEIITKDKARKVCDISFFRYRGSTIPKEIRWFFGVEDIKVGEKKNLLLSFDNFEYDGYIAKANNGVGQTRIFWSNELAKKFEPFSNNGLHLFLEFQRNGIDKYNVRFVKPMELLTTKEKIDQVKAYIAGRGFTYEEGMIENFWLSLKSKPFVILAGTSGTGKTRLVKLFAEAIGAEYRLVPVRPDWSDSSDLLGHHNLAGEFVPGRVLNIILEALKEPEKPFILCLDEMNLARVEYYLSDFLSVIETRDLKDGKIVSDRLLPFEDYGDIRFPENLYLAGTVNMDETTFPFSKKVLDRANTIEFNTVDLMPAVNDFGDEVSPLETGNDFLKSEYLFLSQCLNEENREFIDSVCSDLETINRVLKANNAHVGYRVRDEIVFYMLNNRNADLLSRDAAMDNAVMQKILPRIQGSSAAVKDMLCELFKIFAGDFEGYQTRNNDTATGMFDTLSKSSDIRYPKSAEKTAFMVRRFDEDGFTSYWL